jgi:hypothetical protein
MTSDAPTPPDSLPTYIADGLPKQDDQTLQDIQAYIDALLEHRSKPIEETDLPDEVEPIEDSDGPGTVVKEKVKCGDESCRCSSGNPEDMHGPYLYRYYRNEGNVKSEYEGKP